MTKKGSRARDKRERSKEKQEPAIAPDGDAGLAARRLDVQWMRGVWVSLTTIANDCFVSQITDYDSHTSIVALQAPATDVLHGSQSSVSTTRKYDVRLLKTSFIKDISLLSGMPGQALDSHPHNSLYPASIDPHNTGLLLPINSFDEEMCKKREAQSIRTMHDRVARIGVGVVQEAQDIFDALCKTMECRWNEQQIIVLDLVIISPPYMPANCKSNNAGALNRVQKVLEGERRKLFGDETIPTVTSATTTNARHSNGISASVKAGSK